MGHWQVKRVYQQVYVVRRCGYSLLVGLGRLLPAAFLCPSNNAVTLAYIRLFFAVLLAGSSLALHGQSGQVEMEQTLDIRRFGVEIRTGRVIVSWEAENRTQVSQAGSFTIEKSADGEHWSPVAEQPLGLSRLQRQGYRAQAPYDTSDRYFRLLVQLKDAEAPTVMVTTRLAGQASQLQLLADAKPEIRSVNLRYELEGARELLVKVFNHFGEQVVARKIPSGASGAYEHLFVLPGLQTGTYLMVITQLEGNIDLAEYRLDWP